MKKMLFGLILMMASFAVSAATISIGNPTVTPGNYTVGTPGYSNNLLTDTQRTDTINSGYLTAWVGGSLTTSWVLSSDVDASFTLSVGASSAAETLFIPFIGLITLSQAINMSSWTVSVLNETTGWQQSGDLNTSFDLSISVGDVVRAVVMGSIAPAEVKTYFTSLSLSNIAVSEVPLPAAVWLFGSVLMGAVALRRRKVRQVAVAA